MLDKAMKTLSACYTANIQFYKLEGFSGTKTFHWSGFERINAGVQVRTGVDVCAGTRKIAHAKHSSRPTERRVKWSLSLLRAIFEKWSNSGSGTGCDIPAHLR